MKKFTLAILATTLLFSIGCSNEPKTIEGQAKAELQTYFDAIEDGEFLSTIYNSEVMEDRVFLDQMVNTAAKNLDEDIYYQGAKTLRSLCEVADTQAENIALYMLLQNITEDSKEDEEVLAEIKKQAQISSKQIKQFAKGITAISYTKFETLHEHDAFKQIISKIDKPTSKLIEDILKNNMLPTSAEDFTYTKLDETTVVIAQGTKIYSDLYNTTFYSTLKLRKNGEKWEYFDGNDDQIILKVDQEVKEESFKEIASMLYFDSVSPEGQIDKAKKIQMLKLFDESLTPLKEKMEYEDFETSLSQLMVFLFSAMYSM